MKIDSLILEVRPRTPWEAMDLAVRLVMSHWALLASSWMVSIFPLFIIINLILLKDYPLLTFFLLWFLKPLYDRIPLFVLSRIIFAEKTTWQDVLNAIPSLLKTHLFSSLTIYRFDPGRSFALPVRQLEGLIGQQRRERMKTLHKGNNREVLFFILCFHLETLISWGLIGLLLMMLPTDMAVQGAEEIFLNEEPGLLLNSLSMGLYFISLMLIETIYVAGGFVLYLNRRIILEGWDIELVFRKLAQTQKATKIYCPSFSILLLGVFCLVLSSSFSAEVYAMPQSDSAKYHAILPPVNPVALAANQSKKVIEAVMNDPVFNRIKEIETLEYTGDMNQSEPEYDHLWLTDIMESMGKTLAFIFEIALWMIALMALVLLLKYRHHLHFGFGSISHSKNTQPEVLLGLDIREESLPDNIIEQVLKLYHAHDHRSAMALLYRATLSKLVQEYHFDLKKGATEGDCLTLVTKKLPLSSQEKGHYFKELTQVWQLTAYAHQMISEEKIMDLCHHWSLFYEENKDHE